MAKQTAPNELEVIRTFLNTWRIPNDTRVAVDLLKDEEAFKQFMTALVPHSVQLNALGETLAFRQCLRDAVETGQIAEIKWWLLQYPIQALIDLEDDRPSVRFEPTSETSIAYLLKIVMDATARGQWPRLKACPDCRWVFYDHSKNASKRWCGMYAKSAQGRACGTIAKVKRYRQKRQADRP
jgi:predicted RNA-binding Zn ribbon-like protein